MARHLADMWRVAPLLAAALLLGACSATPSSSGGGGSGDGGVAAISHFRAGRPNYKVGAPYEVKGVWYYPSVDYSYDKTGIASWYGGQFDGQYTANGEIFHLNDLTAAHTTLPLPSIVEVTNLQNGRSLRLRVNDRGPFADGRIIDVSRRAAQLLGFEVAGTAPVRVQVLRGPSIRVAEAAMHNSYGTETALAAASEPPALVAPAPVAPQPVRLASAAPPAAATYPAPAYAAPAYAAPAYPSPAYSAPAYQAPAYQAPAYQAPAYAAATQAAPTLSPPAYAAPPSGAGSPPASSYSVQAYSAPAYSAPADSSRGYGAPAYDAPAYRAPAPVATASLGPTYVSPPTYRAPVRSEPVYRAPLYAASAERISPEPRSVERPVVAQPGVAVFRTLGSELPAHEQTVRREPGQHLVVRCGTLTRRQCAARVLAYRRPSRP